MARPIPSLEEFHIDPQQGFLLHNPLQDLPEYFQPWVVLGRSMDQFVSDKRLREEVEKMPLLDHTKLQGYKQWRLANILLSFIGTGYIWQEGMDARVDRVPAALSLPWAATAQHLGLPLILMYTHGTLSNWRLVDCEGTVEMEHLRMICKAPAPEETEWFFATGMCTEFQAAPGINAIVNAMHGVNENQEEKVGEALAILADSINNILRKAFVRMSEKLSPATFFGILRPFFFGWGADHNSPGIIFEGVNNNRPMEAMGASAGQSPVFQCFDAALGIAHEGEARRSLQRMQEYMLPDHRRFIQAVEEGPRIREYVKSKASSSLTEAYNHCIEELVACRNYHFQMTTRNIVIPSRRESIIGSGSTVFVPFLKSVRNTTQSCLLPVE